MRRSLRHSRRIRFHIKNEELDRLADWLDTRYRGPLGFRFGWDGLIGLIPVVGDLFTNLLAAFILFRAAMAGYPLSLILRMFLNLIFDNLIGAIPLAGNVADFFFRANARNIQLMRAYNLDPQATKRGSKVWLATVLIVAFSLFALLFAAVGYLMWTLGTLFWDFLSENSALITV